MSFSLHLKTKKHISSPPRISVLGYSLPDISTKSLLQIKFMPLPGICADEVSPKNKSIDKTELQNTIFLNKLLYKIIIRIAYLNIQ